eukprot:13093122-Ditylum_brightwellii.AAC.1
MQTCTQLPEKDLAIMALQLTFGGAPGPYEWGVLLEAICDLTSTILCDNAWLPDALCSPIQHLVPPKRLAPQDVPMGIAEQLIVDIPVDPRGTINVYIDNTIGLTVDLPGTDNVAQLEQATPLAIHVAARPVSTNKPLPHNEMASLSKLVAEA